MVTIIGVILVLLGIIVSLVQLRNSDDTKQDIFYVLFTITLNLAYLKINEISFSSANAFVFYSLIGIVALSYLLKQVLKNRLNVLKMGLPILLTFSVFVIPLPEQFTFFDSYQANPMLIFAFALLGAIFPILKNGILNLIVKLTKPNWGEQESNFLSLAINYLFLALLALLSNQFLGLFGVLVALSFYTSSVVFNKKTLMYNGLVSFSNIEALILISFASIILSIGNFEVVDMSKGEVLLGLFFAGFLTIIHKIILLLASKTESGLWRFIYAFKATIISIFFGGALISIYALKENLGGVLTIVGLIIGLALINSFITFFLKRNSTSLHLSIVGIGLILAPYFKPIEIKSNSDLSLIQKDASISVEDQAGESIDIALGKWKIVNDKSTLSFELGPKSGRTKGKFKQITGEINIPRNTATTRFNVKMPINSLTTFNKTRDEHLMEVDWFNEDKFKSITFSSDSLLVKGDKYIAYGNMKMLGIKHPLNIEFKVLGKAKAEGKEILILTGSSNLDRRDFGMSPDASTGNIVDFKFDLQLEK